VRKGNKKELAESSAGSKEVNISEKKVKKVKINPMKKLVLNLFQEISDTKK
jgi:hypothetical protein